VQFLSRNQFWSVVLAGVLAATSASAQSLLDAINPTGATGVERGSTELIGRVEQTSYFATFDTFGAEDIGRSVGSVAAALRDVAAASDQLDVLAVLAGPVETGEEELLGFGLGYSLDAPTLGLTFFASGDASRVTLGSDEARALDVTGDQWRFSIGARGQRALAEGGKLTGVLDFSARRSEADVLGFRALDEDLRVLRGVVAYVDGSPFGARRSASANVRVGLPLFGASDRDNALASRRGASAGFTAASFSADGAWPVQPWLFLRGGLVGQFSPDSLPFSQRCGFSTNRFSRAFDRSFVNGDSCLGARQEVAALLPAAAATGGALAFAEAFVATDFGVLWDQPSGGADARREGWSSLYGGLRVASSRFVAELSVSRILDGPPDRPDQDRTRVWFRGAVRF